MKIRRRRGQREGQRGGALVLSLAVVTTISVVSVSMFQMNQSIARSKLRAADDKRAFYVAEAGLAEAYAALTRGACGQVGDAACPVAFGSGLFWVDAADLDRGRVGLRSTALVGSGRASVCLVVEPDDRSPRALSWRIAELPAAVRSRKLDPFSLLEVDGRELPSPDRAHRSIRRGRARDHDIRALAGN